MPGFLRACAVFVRRGAASGGAAAGRRVGMGTAATWPARLATPTPQVSRIAEGSWDPIPTQFFATTNFLITKRNDLRIDRTTNEGR